MINYTYPAKVILETPRLILREMSLADLDFVAAMLADPEVMRFYPKCHSREESETWVQRQLNRYARHGHGLWLVREKATGQPRGAGRPAHPEYLRRGKEGGRLADPPAVLAAWFRHGGGTRLPGLCLHGPGQGAGDCTGSARKRVTPRSGQEARYDGRAGHRTAQPF
jgi:RimJ/RimL family protein N-acetyltransferase